MAERLHSLTALGADAPMTRQIGGYRIAERFDIALASLAVRRGRSADVARAASTAGVPLPEPARRREGTPFCAFWVATEMWFVEAPFASHEDIVAMLKPAFGDAASLTEQTDAWARFDLSAPDLAPLMARLCNVDFPAAPPGFVTRTVIEHLGCYVVKHGAGEATLYGPRSSARSLLHCIEVAAGAID